MIISLIYHLSLTLQLEVSSTIRLQLIAPTSVPDSHLRFHALIFISAHAIKRVTTLYLI